MKQQLSKRRYKLWILGCVATLAATPALAESSFSYPRVLEGSATLTAATGETESVDLHQPILVGDRIYVPYDSRLELVLADRSLLRLGGDSEIDFEAVAYSADTEDRSTALRMHRGETQLIVPEDAFGDALPRIETRGATIDVYRAGNYRITAEDDGWTELVVRDGLAEMTTDRGSMLVQAGESGRVRGGYSPRIELRVADSRDALERWGDWLSAEAARADVPYVEESIRYAARPLADHGVWVEIGHRRAWRPTAVVDWRPYVHGYWRHTPVGLTWVSRDPWGYVTHHYGSWDLVPGYGWVWYPGAAYAPARVHWYWGPTYVGWCPTGYYRNHYAGYRRGHGLSFGLYGWAGGSWDPFRHWSFTLVANFGGRHQHRHVHHGAHFGRRHARLERGIITTEPRLRRGRHHEAFDDLRREVERRERQDGRPLPDVSAFVDRKPLAPDLERAVLKPRTAIASVPETPARRDDRGRLLPGADTGPRTARAKPIAKPRPEPRFDTPRADRPKPVARPRTEPRFDTPRADRSKPAVKPRPQPRYDAPQADRPKPVVKPRPAPRVDRPRADRPRPVVKPRPQPRYDAPRADRSKPVVKPRPAPRVDRPRADRPKPVVKPRPAPRVDRPRADRPRPVVKPRPQPRVDRPRADRPRPVVKPRPQPRVDRKPVVKDRSGRRDQPRAQAPKRPKIDKKADSRARSKDSTSRRRDG